MPSGAPPHVLWLASRELCFVHQPHDHYSKNNCTREANMAALRYVWVPAAACPQVPPFSPTSLCSVTTSSQIMLAGDSLHDQFFNTLVAATNSTCIATPGAGQNDNPNHAVLDCGQGRLVDLMFWRSAYLTEEMDDNHEDQRYIDRVLQSTHGSTVIFNRGPHWMDDKDVLLQLRHLFSRLRTSRPDLLLIYRSSSTAHDKCGDSTSPLLVPPTPVPMRWHTDQLQAQNLKVKAMLEVEYPGVLWMDAYAISILRPDSHAISFDNADCLHCEEPTLLRAPRMRSPSAWPERKKPQSFPPPLHPQIVCPGRSTPGSSYFGELFGCCRVLRGSGAFFRVDW